MNSMMTYHFKKIHNKSLQRTALHYAPKNKGAPFMLQNKIQQSF